MISDVTRLAIVDALALSELGLRWSGQMDEDGFLSRLYDLSSLPSTDGRFKDATGDIWQHRVNNPEDWDDDWVFYDPRFNLMHCDDETYLRFLTETLHPRVQRSTERTATLAKIYNTHLRHDGYELVPVSELSGYPVFAARSAFSVPSTVRELERSNAVADRDHMARLITRMEAAIVDDPELAIGTAKDLIEAACKTILEYHAVEWDRRWSIGKLARETSLLLKLTPDGVADDAPAAQTIRQILGSLASVVAGTAELRNNHGSGHGKGPSQYTLQPRHARLVVGAASTLAMFLFDTFEQHSTGESPVG